MKNSELLKSALLAMMLAVGGVGLVGCASDGPMEEAGEAVDEAIDDVEDAID